MSIFCSSSMKLILIYKLFIIKWVEIAAFSFIRKFGGVADHISIRMIPPMVIVSLKSLFVINLVNKHSILSSVLFKIG
jgi:hypothetical protein